MLACTPSRLDVALDLETDITRQYTGDYFFEELHGIADASEVNYKVSHMKY